MDNNLKLGRLAGFFLIMMVLAGMPAVMLRGINSSMLENPDLLATVIEKSNTMRLSILLSFTAGVFGVFFSVTAYQVLSRHSKFSAVTFLTLWIIQVAVAIMGDVFHYTLLESAQYVDDLTMGTDSLLPIAAVSVKGYIGAHFLSLILFSGSFVFLHTHFMKFGLLPKWLTIWGILASGIVFIVTWLRIFDWSVSFYFYNQNGLFMLGFTTYMLIKGFKAVDEK